MCYKVSTPLKEKFNAYIEQRHMVGFDYDMYYHANGFANPYLPVTLSALPQQVVPARWGLLPTWVKTAEQAKQYKNTLNAVSEEIFSKTSYKNYIRKYRCLLWVGGFYESKTITDKNKQPYFIHRPDGEPFTLGCVYAPSIDFTTGQYVPTFSIITTPANEMLSAIHNSKKRMPLVIREQDREAWLTVQTDEKLVELMRPLPDGILQAHPVSKDVNKGAINEPYLQDVITI